MGTTSHLCIDRVGIPLAVRSDPSHPISLRSTAGMARLISRLRIYRDGELSRIDSSARNVLQGIPEPNTVARVIPAAAISARLDVRGTTMNNRYVDAVGQNDRELEELLCLAYLFTHSVCAEAPDEYEVLLTDNGDMFPILTWN